MLTTYKSHLLDASVGVALGTLSFLLSLLVADRALSIIGGLFPLFLAISSLHLSGIIIAILIALVSHTLLVGLEPNSIFTFFSPVVFYIIVNRITQLLTPLILGVSAYLTSLGSNHQFDFVFGVLFACFLAGTLRRTMFWSNLIKRTRPKGQLAFVVPLFSMVTLAPFSLDLLPTSFEAPFLLLITAVSLGFLPKTEAGYDTESNRNIIDSLLSRPRGFSGFGKDFWERRDKEPMEAVALTSRLTAQISVREKSNPLSKYEAVCAINRAGRISFLNRKFRDYLGIKSNQVIGKNIDELGIDASITSYLLQLVERTLVYRDQLGEIRINLPQGNRFFEVKTMKADSLESSSLSDAPDSVIMILTDITARRTIESQFLKSQKLESLGTISIKAIEKLKSALSEVPEQFKEEFKSINELVSQLESFAMNDSSQKQSVDLSALVENHVKVLNYPINLDIAPNGRYTVVCDQAQILQAITNLVINAAESYQAGRKGSIDISLSNETLSEDVVGLQLGARPGEYVRLRVKDTGLGMTPDVLQRAFEPFFTTKASSGHQGLGLSIVFAIVRDHDGFLSAESSSNSGTTISLYLPLIS
jgi:signal transduction histidine kinase